MTHQPAVEPRPLIGQRPINSWLKGKKDKKKEMLLISWRTCKMDLSSALIGHIGPFNATVLQRDWFSRESWPSAGRFSSIAASESIIIVTQHTRKLFFTIKIRRYWRLLSPPGGCGVDWRLLPPPGGCGVDWRLLPLRFAYWCPVATLGKDAGAHGVGCHSPDPLTSALALSDR